MTSLDIATLHTDHNVAIHQEHQLKWKKTKINQIKHSKSKRKQKGK